MKWNPYTVIELNKSLAGLPGWFLDGGYSLELILGKSSREHGDIDIGTYSRDAKSLLSSISALGYQIYIANKGNLDPYQETEFSELNNNYWVSDGESFRFQLLVYKLKGGKVYFRRNQEVCWPEADFLIEKNNMKVVNPLITYAFKVTTSTVEEKDLIDISLLLKWVAETAKQLQPVDVTQTTQLP